jgi:uncharacterized protein YciI
MMWYVIHAKDNANSLEKRIEVRQKHLSRLNDLQNNGRLLIAGPLPSIDNEDPGPNGFDGSLIIAEFASLQEAQNWAEKDPYLEAGVYESFTVQPFKKVLPQ